MTHSSTHVHSCVTWLIHVWHDSFIHTWVNRSAHVLMPSHVGWLRFVGSLNLQVSFAKEPYKRDDILQKSVTHEYTGLITSERVSMNVSCQKDPQKRPSKETLKRTKETHKTHKRQEKLLTRAKREKRPIKESHKRDPQKRPTKETHKRDPQKSKRDAQNTQATRDASDTREARKET